MTGLDWTCILTMMGVSFSQHSSSVIGRLDSVSASMWEGWLLISGSASCPGAGSTSG